MKTLSLLIALFCSQLSFAGTTPCVPGPNTGTYPYCMHYAGQAQASFQMVHIPTVDFPSNSGTMHVWVNAPTSLGAWRVRIMKFDMITPVEIHNQQQHFHQVAHSDLSVTGNAQEIVYNADAGFYRFEVECENDCAGKNFDLFVWVP